MKLTKCEQGHFYDGDKYPACPYCNTDLQTETAIVHTSEGASPAQSASPDGPVAGWLVVLDGPARGRDLRLGVGRSFVGLDGAGTPVTLSPDAHKGVHGHVEFAAHVGEQSGQQRRVGNDALSVGADKHRLARRQGLVFLLDVAGHPGSRPGHIHLAVGLLDGRQRLVERRGIRSGRLHTGRAPCQGVEGDLVVLPLAADELPDGRPHLPEIHRVNVGAVVQRHQVADGAVRLAQGTGVQMLVPHRQFQPGGLYHGGGVGIAVGVQGIEKDIHLGYIDVDLLHRKGTRPVGGDGGIGRRCQAQCQTEQHRTRHGQDEFQSFHTASPVMYQPLPSLRCNARRAVTAFLRRGSPWGLRSGMIWISPESSSSGSSSVALRSGISGWCGP